MEVIFYSGVLLLQTDMYERKGGALQVLHVAVSCKKTPKQPKPKQIKRKAKSVLYLSLYGAFPLFFSEMRPWK